MDIHDDVKQAVAREVSHAVAKRVATLVAIFTGFIVFIALGGVVVRLLWNWLLPELFGFPPITFWQALGLLALSRILFGGFGHHDRTSYGGRRREREWWRKHRQQRSSPAPQNGQA